MFIRFLLLLFSTASFANAIPWGLETLDSGNETGAVSAVAVDRAGRMHTVYSTPASSSNYDLIYRLRSNGSTGFTSASDFTAVIAVRLALSRPLHVSIDVTDDFVVQVATVDLDGSVRVYEKTNPLDLSWSATTVSELAATDGNGGVSLRSRGDNGASASALAFTKQQSGVSGGVQFCQQESDGSWSTAIDVFTGIGTGQAPVLLNTGSTLSPQMIVSYNAAEGRIQQALFALRAPDFSRKWRAPEEVAEALSATRPDAEARNGFVGIAFVSSGADGGVRPRYASRSLGSFDPWAMSEVASVTEVNPFIDIHFGPLAALTFDAERNPWISYTHEVDPAAVRRTSEIRARRLLPGIGWELSTVETITSTGSGLAITDSLSLDAGDSGDPVMIYERDSTGNSEVIFARPIASPWQLKPALATFGGTQRSNPTLVGGTDGTLHLAYTQSGDIHVASLFADSESVESIVSPGYHQYIAMTQTPDGTLHLAAVRLSSESATTAELVYTKRPVGGTFSTPEVVVGQPAIVPGAEILPIVLRSDSAGALYILYNPRGFGLRLLKRKGSADPWTYLIATRFSIPTSQTDLAVRADGGYAFTMPWRGSVNSAFTLVTNIDALTGAVTGELEFHQWTFPETISDTKCMILPNGHPVGALASGDSLRLVFPDGSGEYANAIQGERDAFPEAKIALSNIGGDIHLVAHSTQSGGTVSDLLLTPDAVSGYTAEVETFTQPELELAPVSAQPFSGTVDSAGFPAIALTLRSNPGTPLENHTIYLARPADAIDPDGDTIPLLLEGAYDLDPYSSDSLSLLPSTEVVKRPDELLMRHFIRTPAVPLTGYGAKGEYTYRIESSQDLRNWSEEVDIPGQISVGELLLLPGPSAGIESRYYGGFFEENRRRFSRVKIFRDR